MFEEPTRKNVPFVTHTYMLDNTPPPPNSNVLFG